MEKPDIEKLFAPFGKIMDVRIPTVNKDGKTKKRGFAFVRFQSRNSAVSASKKLNGQQYDGRPLVVDIAIGASEYIQATGSAVVAENTESNETVSEPKSKRAKIDIVAEALTMVKRRKEIAVSENEEDEDERKSESSSLNDDESVSSSSDLSSLSGSEDNDDVSSSIYASSSGSDDEDDDEKSDVEASEEEHSESDKKDKEVVTVSNETSHPSNNTTKKEQGHDVGELKTIFVRNVPFDATETELIQVFKRFGSVDFAKIVKSKVDGSSRGTAFIKFRAVHSAERVMQEEVEVQKRLQEASGMAFGNMAIATGGRAAKMAMSAPLEDLGVSLHNRRLICSSAVTPNESANLTARKGDENDGTRNKRRAMLEKLSVGRVNLDDENAIKGMSKADAKRRNEAWDVIEKRTANPNITLNPLRLSIQNLPVHADGAQLREALGRALLRDPAARREMIMLCNNEDDKVRLSEWSNGLRGVLDMKKDKKYEEVIPKALRRAFASVYHAAVPKVHVVKDASRTIEDADGKKVHRSMGYAFVEFKSETLSKLAIFNLNNDPTAFSDVKRPVVNFALEDARALKEQKKKEDIMLKRQERKAAKAAADAVEGGATIEKGKKRKNASANDTEDGQKRQSRGQKQREKKRQERSERGDETDTSAFKHVEKKNFVNKKFLSKPYKPGVHGSKNFKSSTRK